MQKFIGTKADLAFTPHNDKLTPRDLKNIETIHKLFKHDVMNVGKPMPVKKVQKRSQGVPAMFDRFMTDEEWWASPQYKKMVNVGKKI